VSNEASKQKLPCIHSKHILQSDMLISLFLTHMSLFSDTYDSSLAAKTKTPQAKEPIINYVFP
jgi:hypothetical protein